MKRILLAVLLSSAPAFAGIQFDFRADYLNNAKYTDGTNADVNGQSYFSVNRARTRFYGNFNETISYNARLDFLKPSDSTGTGDGANTLVNYAEIANKFSDMMTLKVGKLSDSGISAWEGVTSPGDTYFTSMTYFYPYLVGAQLDTKLDDNTFSLYAVNGAEATKNDNTQARSGLGLTYKGFFMEKSLNFIASYHALPTTSAIAQTNTYGAFGVQYKAGDLYIDANYLMSTFGKQSVNGTDDAKKNSVVATVKYALGAWVPNLKLEQSTVDSLAATSYETNNAATATASKVYGVTLPSAAYKNTVMQYAAGVEYKPKSDENFRYHLEYINKATKFDSTIAAATNSTVTESKIIAGVRIVADVLK